MPNDSRTPSSVTRRMRFPRGRRVALLAALLIASGDARAAGDDVLEIVDTWTQRTGLDDVAVYEPGSGPTLAVVGTIDGTAFVDISSAGAPVEIGFVPGPPSDRRSVAVGPQHAYVAPAPETPGGGLQVVDLSGPSPTLVATLDAAFDGAVDLAMDPSTGYLYVTGTASGLHVLDAPIHWRQQAFSRHRSTRFRSRTSTCASAGPTRSPMVR